LTNTASRARDDGGFSLDIHDNLSIAIRINRKYVPAWWSGKTAEHRGLVRTILGAAGFNRHDQWQFAC